MAGSKEKSKSQQKDNNNDEKNADNKCVEEEQQRQETPRDEKKKTQSDNKSESGNKGDKQKKEFFKEELKRLKTSLDKEKSKIKEPEKKEHTPDTFNRLDPYFNTHSAEFIIELPPEVDHGYSSRQTAKGLVDPWEDHRMDTELLPKTEVRTPRDEQDADKDDKDKDERPKKEGSTRLPKYPEVKVPAGDMSTRTLYYSDVPMLREELKKSYSSSADGKIDDEYKRTKADYYRMELDKIEEYHPSNRENMRATYFAYLQNNPGSKKAIYECVKSSEQKQKEKDTSKESETPRTARSQKSTARSRQPDSARSSHSNKKQTQAAKA